MTMPEATVYIVMGVSGCGKSTLAPLLAQACKGDWLDADNFHTPEAKAKMHSGIPLTDEDRWPWLHRLNAELRKASQNSKPLFLACSALRQIYRDRLTTHLPHSRIIYMKGTFDFIHARLAKRKNHFMPAGLLESQFATLEEPTGAIVLDISKTDAEMIEDFQNAVAA